MFLYVSSTLLTILCRPHSWLSRISSNGTRQRFGGYLGLAALKVTAVGNRLVFPLPQIEVCRLERRWKEAVLVPELQLCYGLVFVLAWK